MCAKAAEPVTFDRDSNVPSPKLTSSVWTWRGALVLPLEVVTVIAAGDPATTGDGETSICRLGAADTSTRTLPFAAPAKASTTEVWVVVSCVLAVPLLSVVAVVGFNVPVPVTNCTFTPGRGLLASSNTSAEMVTVPPLCDTLVGDDDMEIAPAAAAAPILIVAAPELEFPEPVRAPPEKA